MRAAAVYKALLHCYPAAFRQEYGNQMLLMFAEQLGEARRSGGRLQQTSLWLRATADALIVAPREHWHVVVQDLRYAIRTMAAAPGFALVAIVSLALGIGANTAIFSLWNGVLHAALPGVHEPQQLVVLTNPNESGSWNGRQDFKSDGPRSWLTYEEFELLRQRADHFSALMATQSTLSDWDMRIDGGPPEVVHGRLVSDGFFQTLGVGAAVGRVFSTSDNCAPALCAVISFNYWQRRFTGNTDVLGKTLAVRLGSATIVGVAPRGFIGESADQQPDVWLPLHTQPIMLPGVDRLHDTPPDKVMWLHVFGRLKPGITLAQAESQANAIFHAGLEPFYGALASGPRRDEYLDQKLQLHPGAGGVSSSRFQLSDSLTALLVAVGVVLLIACANLANLLLARGAARRSEIALRVSLGASRERIMRQLITESLALAAMGGAAALAVAYALHRTLVRMLAEYDPDFQVAFTLDPRVLAFVVVATVAAALLFGVLPAWQATKTDMTAALKEQTRGAIGSLRQMRSGRLLVSLQLALSVPLLVGAGLLARTVYNLQRADLGFPSQELLLTRVDFREAGYEEAARRETLLRELAGQFQRTPGVKAVSFSQLGIFSGGESSTSIDVEGYTAKGRDDNGSTRDVVGPGYFSTLGVPLIAGRDILESDRAGGLKVCVINEAFAKVFFEGRNPIGMRVSAVFDDTRRVDYRVVGVARNARTQHLRSEIEPRYYVPMMQELSYARGPVFLIRTAAAPSAMVGTVRKTIERIDPSLPMSATSLEEKMRPLTAQDRTTAQLAVVFGVVALALAAIGLYGVLSYGIARRTGEIAVRIALGAQRRRVVSMILGETSILVVAGLALGGGLAYGATQLIGSQLYGVKPQDPLTLAAAVVVLLLVAFGATYLPARRASRLDPIVALRHA